MADIRPVHLGVTPEFLEELLEVPLSDREAFIEDRLRLRDVDLGKAERFLIIEGAVAERLDELRERPEVEWVEPIGRQYAI